MVTTMRSDNYTCSCLISGIVLHLLSICCHAVIAVVSRSLPVTYCFVFTVCEFCISTYVFPTRHLIWNMLYWIKLAGGRRKSRSVLLAWIHLEKAGKYYCVLNNIRALQYSAVHSSRNEALVLIIDTTNTGTPTPV